MSSIIAPDKPIFEGGHEEHEGLVGCAARTAQFVTRVFYYRKFAQAAKAHEVQKLKYQHLTLRVLRALRGESNFIYGILKPA